MSIETVTESSGGVLGPGAMMRNTRESKGIHITLLATTLRVPVERLKSLETEQWAELPDLVFARALAMSVCRQLKIDPAPVLAAMPDPDPMRSVRVTAANSAPLGGMTNTHVGQSQWWIGVGVALLALLVWFGWGMQLDQDARPSTSVEVPAMPPNLTVNSGPAVSSGDAGIQPATSPGPVVITPVDPSQTSPGSSAGVPPSGPVAPASKP
ncbi:MAG: helix-turn-helix domain-containing protein [Alphaproteobacteria bacterium]|nr:helix-turn-helix domain-containing protein [Alphaproteobacteria bacterium]